MSFDDKKRPTSYQFLTIHLDDELFAVEVPRVREILDFPPITKIPRTPEFLRGVVNIRGNVVPVVDLKLKFGIGRTEKSVNTCVVVVEVSLDGEPVVLGVLADSCEDVIEVAADQLEPPPHLGSRLRVEFLAGIGKLGDRFFLYLDLDRIFSADELALVRSSAEPGAVAGGGTG